MAIDPKYFSFFENVYSNGEKKGEVAVSRCFHCVSSRLFTWSHPSGFGEKDYRPLDVIDLEWKETDKKKKTSQHIARVYCFHLKQFIPQAEFLDECRFFTTPSEYEYRKSHRS
jgi:hypothetical protein